ncbi:MAG: VanZ family protein [Chloroflexi bacterium]|nr:MAG: VanZ family protein [Chloroflexota bacterium]
MSTTTIQKFIKRWGPTVLIMAVIYFASSLSSGEVPHFEGILDYIIKKGGHMTGYALLALAYLRGIGKTSSRAIFFAWFLAVAYALTDELHQSLTPGRTPRFTDIGFDAAGAFLGLLAYSIIRKTWSEKAFPRITRI